LRYAASLPEPVVAEDGASVASSVSQPRTIVDLSIRFDSFFWVARKHLFIFREEPYNEEYSYW